ncbi:unnamed protein product [Spirodela intermedia]|uniref:LOB domain-containing protein n=1 Tax=Spirodela intermedia TaxID=51605 RepID=A0A7I8KBQ2_SPIIN|nr:unnamed protein product [Spirodela intermedia]
MASSSSSPCAACKFLRRKCVPGCVFAPYFPQDESARFVNVHRVFGASNVAKILNDLPPAGRRDAVTSLCFEAEVQLQDPVHGCLGYILTLQHQLQEIQQTNAVIKREIQALHPQASLDGITLPPMPTALEPSYHHPMQITEQQDVLQGGDQHQHQHQNLGAHPHQQLDTMRYNEGIMNSGGGPPTVLALAPQQFHSPTNHHPYYQDQRQN